MPIAKVRNVTQQQIDHAHSKAEEIYQRSSNMTRSDFQHVVAEDILENQDRYQTVEDVLKDIDYCEETGDNIRADAMYQFINEQNLTEGISLCRA
jgi:hypothetical protein